jgi:hypothetical protein
MSTRIGPLCALTNPSDSVLPVRIFCIAASAPGYATSKTRFLAAMWNRTPTNLGLNRANDCQESYAKECTPSKESWLSTREGTSDKRIFVV